MCLTNVDEFCRNWEAVNEYDDLVRLLSQENEEFSLRDDQRLRMTDLTVSFVFCYRLHQRRHKSLPPHQFDAALRDVTTAGHLTQGGGRR